MDRRLLLTALACWSVGRLRAEEEAPRPRHRISAAQLHSALSARFPVQLVIGGLLALQVSAPRLLLLPARDQLGAALVMQPSGPRLQPMPAGEVDVVFALRYEAADQTVRAHRPDILDLRWPGVPAETLRALRGSLHATVRQAVGEVVLHKFLPRELALADAMGFEPEKLSVVDDGLVISFGPKLRR